jgi:hypothetical protein
MFAARETGDSFFDSSLSPAIAGSIFSNDSYLGLASQALCVRLLRRLI